MYALRNKVQLIGHLGEAPTANQITSQKRMARFSIATNENYRNSKGEQVNEVQWHRIVAWGKVAAIVEKFLKKGDEVAIEGKLVTRSHIDPEGIKRYIVEVEAREILLLRAKHKHPDAYYG